LTVVRRSAVLSTLPGAASLGLPKFTGKGWEFSPAATQSHKAVALGSSPMCPLY
jgi:hypothetical protein